MTPHNPPLPATPHYDSLYPLPQAMPHQRITHRRRRLRPPPLKIPPRGGSLKGLRWGREKLGVARQTAGGKCRGAPPKPDQRDALPAAADDAEKGGTSHGLQEFDPSARYIDR